MAVLHRCRCLSGRETVPDSADARICPSGTDLLTDRLVMMQDPIEGGGGLARLQRRGLTTQVRRY
jgi:hypothetical protein